MSKPLRVLMVEDSEDDALLMMRTLKKGGYEPEYEQVETAKAMRTALQEKTWDVILCDYQMPQFNGMDALALYKETDLDTPFIIVSGTIGEETAVGAMKAGAHDYVMKSNLPRLIPAIERELKEAESRRQRKRAEEALTKSEEKFRKVFYTSPDSANISRLEDGMNIAINPGFTRITGYTEEDIIGKTSIEYKFWENIEDRQRLVAGLKKEREVTNLEAAFRMKDGEIRYGLLSASVIDLDGVPHILSITRDITDRKRAEKALKESENKYRLLADNVNDVIFVLDMNMNYTYVSPSVKILRGYEPAELLKQPSTETLTPSSWDLAAKTLSEAMEVEKSEHSEIPISRTLQLEMMRKDGTTLWTEVKFSFIRDENQRPEGILGVTRDITERMQQEEEREKTLMWQRGVNLLQQSLLASATLEEKLRVTTDSIVSLFDADFSRIWLIQPGDLCEQGCIHADVDEEPHICRYRNRCLHLLASSGRYTHTDGKTHRRVPFGCYKIGRVASDDDHKFLTNDVQNDPRIHNHEWARELGLVSFVGYQLRVPGGKTLGVLALFAKHPISSQEDATLDGLSSAVALVIQRDIAEKSLHQTLESLSKAIQTTIQVMVSAVETRDPYTAGHQRRSTDLARAIATEMGLPQENIEAIRMAGPIHDIGKLSIPAEILSKPTILSEIEFALIKEHSRAGYEILKDVESPWPLAEIVYQHHERMDGSGYPRNLKGDDILMEARIMAVADVVESMASHRPYRPTLGIDAALEEISKNRVTHYDNAVADACLRLFREKGYQLKRA